MSVDIQSQRSDSAVMEDDHEDFEDAFEDLPVLNPEDLDKALEDAHKAIHFFFNNQFDEARNTLKAYANSSLYHSLGTAVFAFLEAVLTFQQDHIKLASDALKTCVNVCDGLRRKNTMYETLGKMVKRPNYSSYTTLEIHAELCYAEALLLKSVLTFVEDETLVTFIKAGLKIRSCYNSYKECAEILNSRDWSSDPHKVHFESGVRMGIGAFNLMISLLPARVIKLLEFIGFGGSKDLGLRELQQGYELRTSLRQVLCVMLLLAYHLIIVYVLSHRDGDLALCDEILEEQLAKYPQGVWFLFFKARLEFMRGNLEDATSWYVRSWRSQSLWPHFHHLCFWELMFVQCMRLDWRAADEYASLLCEQSRWSRTIYSYQRAAILHMMHDDLTPDQEMMVEELMRTAPRYKQRIAGKSLPMEKFAVKKSERYFAQKKILVLPALELLYMWNLFKVIGKQWALAERVYLLIDVTLKKLESGTCHSEFDADNRALVLLLKGAILQVMNNPLQAQQCLEEVLSLEKQIRDDLYVVPYALVELAVIAQKQDHSQEAIQLVEAARKNYSGYSNESRLHFKMHAIMLDITEQKKNNDVEEAVEASENETYQTHL